MRIHPTGFASLCSARLRVMRVPLSRPLRARLNGAAGCARWQAWLAALAAA
jgi:hypothetical protein